MTTPGVPSRWRTGSIVAGGVRLATFETSAPADAPAVLLLHGLGHWSEGAWDRLVARLDPALRYVALDLPGFGASEKPAARYDRAYFRRVLEEAVEALGLRCFAVVGHSLGGFLAADYAARHPERVTKLALIAPGGFARSLRTAAFGIAGIVAPAFFARVPSRRFVTRVLERSVADPRALDAATLERAVALARGERTLRLAFAAVYRDALRGLLRTEKTRAELARYRGPVFCAWGARDRFIAPRTMRAVVRVYPGARTLLLAASAHLPMLDEPDALARRVARVSGLTPYQSPIRSSSTSPSKTIVPGARIADAIGIPA